MRYFPALLALVILLTLIASCGPNGELETNTVTDAEYQSVQKLRSNQYTLMSNDDLKKLQDDAALGKGVGRYQLHNEGFRTWRLDTATGAICLLLTSKDDWKKSDIEAQSCSNQ